MDNKGRNGAWIGAGLVAAAAIIVTENPWYALLMLMVVGAY